MGFLFTLAAFALAIGILVTVHEFGHYWVARRAGVKILKFSVGFGRPLLKWVGGKDRTEYIIAALPLGGYVKMLGEGGDVEVPEAEKHRAFDNKTLAQRTAIVAAGPAFNLLFAVLAYWFLFTGTHQGISARIALVEPGSIAAEAGLQAGDRITAVAGKETPTWETVSARLMKHLFDKREVALTVTDTTTGNQRPVVLSLQSVDLEQQQPMEEILGFAAQIPVVIGRLVDNSAAVDAGLQVGDEILAVDGQRIYRPRHLSQQIEASQGRPVSLTIKREGTRQTVSLRPRLTEEQGEERWMIGIGFQGRADVEYYTGVVSALGQAGTKVVDMSTLTLKMFYRMAVGEASLKNLSGPVTIAEYAGKTASISAEQFIKFLAIVSISLGMINLLPIPMLDGGHLLYYAIEFIKGSPVSEQAMILGQKIGIVILLLIMSIAISNDIQRIIN